MIDNITRILCLTDHYHERQYLVIATWGSKIGIVIKENLIDYLSYPHDWQGKIRYPDLEGEALPEDLYELVWDIWEEKPNAPMILEEEIFERLWEESY